VLVTIICSSSSYRDGRVAAMTSTNHLISTIAISASVTLLVSAIAVLSVNAIYEKLGIERPLTAFLICVTVGVFSVIVILVGIDAIIAYLPVIEGEDADTAGTDLISVGVSGMTIALIILGGWAVVSELEKKMPDEESITKDRLLSTTVITSAVILCVVSAVFVIEGWPT
jgi:hypothetical protein